MKSVVLSIVTMNRDSGRWQGHARGFPRFERDVVPGASAEPRTYWAAEAGAGGRPPQRDAPPFGRRMAMLRRQKGLSQRELGELLGTTQKTVDYYERRTLNPTLDVIQKVAEALEVSPAQLIGDHNGLMKISRKTGPTSKVQKVFEVVSSLPRRQQEKIIDVVTAIVRQYEQTR